MLLSTRVLPCYLTLFVVSRQARASHNHQAFVTSTAQPHRSVGGRCTFCTQASRAPAPAASMNTFPKPLVFEASLPTCDVAAVAGCNKPIHSLAGQRQAHSYCVHPAWSWRYCRRVGRLCPYASGQAALCKLRAADSTYGEFCLCSQHGWMHISTLCLTVVSVPASDWWIGLAAAANHCQWWHADDWLVRPCRLCLPPPYYPGLPTAA